MYNSIKKYSFRLCKMNTNETNFYVIRSNCVCDNTWHVIIESELNRKWINNVNTNYYTKSANSPMKSFTGY